MKRYFISYVLFKKNKIGFGNTVIDLKEKIDTDVLIKIKNDLIKSNNYDDVMIMNYILMNKENNNEQ